MSSRGGRFFSSNSNEYIGAGGELTAAEEAFVQSANSGIILLTETTAPSATSGIGKLYVKSADSKLYYKNDSGTETEVGGGGSGASTALDNLASVAINTDLLPGASDGAALGSATKMFSDLFLASGSVINLNNGDVTLTHSANTLTLAGGSLVLPDAGLTVGASIPFSDSAGTLTLQNIDAIDATTEATIEAAIDTLANLTTIQGRTVTLADAGANAIFGWDDTAGAYENLTQAEASVIIDHDQTTNFVADEHVAHSGVTLTAGNGLTGGGTIAANRTFAVGAGTGITVNSDDVAVDQSTAFAWTGAHTHTVAGLVLTLTNSADAASSQVAIFQGDRATMADADEAYISLRLSDDAGTQKEVARLTWVATDVNAATNVDGRIDFAVMTAGTLADEMQLDGTALSPSTSDGLALGTTALMWADLFLADGSVINFNNGDVTLTHSSNTLTLAGGALSVQGALTATGTTTLATSLTGVLRADSGVVSVDTDVTDIVTAATENAAGKIEIATTAEIDTGTDTGRAMAPDQFAGSNRGKRIIQVKVYDDATAATTGDGKLHFFIPVELGGMNLVDVEAGLSTASSSGTPTIQIHNVTQAADMLSTRITIDANEKTSLTAAAAPVIDTNNDDVASGDELRIDVDVAGTGAKGLTIWMSFQTP